MITQPAACPHCRADKPALLVISRTSLVNYWRCVTCAYTWATPKRNPMAERQLPDKEPDGMAE